MAKRTRARSPRGTQARGAPATSPSEPYRAVCHGLLAHVAPAERDDGRARALAEAAVAESLGEGWLVTPLSEHARDYRITRGPTGKPIDTGRAWEWTRQLRAHRDVADAEPAIEQPGLEPPPGTTDAAMGTGGMRPRGGDDAALPCASGDCEWSLKLCRVPAAWTLTPPTSAGRALGEGIVVGHPDTGYTQHAEIWDTTPRVRVADGYDFVRRQTDALDTLERGNPGHGTTTASVIMSSSGGSGTTFVSGVAPAATLVPLRVTPRVILLGFDRLAEAIHYAIDRGCHVISMSLGGVTPSGTLQRAVQRAVDNGLVVLAAAGNVWPWVVYPARLDQVIACAACNCEKRVWRHSASGSAVDVTAPGESVWVARPGQQSSTTDDIVDVGSGTSYAVATTAGACALWLAFHGRDALIARYGVGQIAAVFKELLITHGVSTPRGWKTDEHGAGILDVEALLRAPLPATPPASGLAIRASAAPRRANDVDLFLPYFPGVEPGRVQRGLARLLKTTERALPTMLADIGDELVFHVATNPEVRARVLAGGGPKKRGRVMAARAGASPSRLQREGSRELRARLGA